MYLFARAFEEENFAVDHNQSHNSDICNEESEVSIVAHSELENLAAVQLELQLELEQMKSSRIRPFQEKYNRMQFSSCDPIHHPSGFYIRVLAPSVPDLDGKYVTSHVRVALLFGLTSEVH